jgi:hypothetical protein
MQVEVRVLGLAPGSAAGAAVRALLEPGGGGAAPTAGVLSNTAARHIPLAFELRAASCTLEGLDLPALLPDAAALPPLRLLPPLEEDVAAALASARGAEQRGDRGGRPLGHTRHKQA